MPLDEIYVTYLNGLSRGRLATVTPGGSPQNKPVGFRYNADLSAMPTARISSASTRAAW
jgi:pyridoxamine 5'-phosphate oxidase family protein